VKAGGLSGVPHAQLWRVAAALGRTRSGVGGHRDHGGGRDVRMVQTDLKRMLAFSTVSQIGYMMMGIGIGTPLAILPRGCSTASITVFFKGGLFLTAGSVQHASGTAT